MRIEGTNLPFPIEPKGPTARPEGHRAKGAGSLPQDLRSQLSAEELGYFAELERLGPVTYGRKPGTDQGAPPPVLGQRIDVRA